MGASRSQSLELALGHVKFEVSSCPHGIVSRGLEFKKKVS